MKVYDHHGYKHFNGVHWYPRICVYDRKFTWETDQHVEKEFYGDYGYFDISLTLPNHYIAEATGTLVNKEEVLPAALRKQARHRQFQRQTHRFTALGNCSARWHVQNMALSSRKRARFRLDRRPYLPDW